MRRRSRIGGEGDLEGVGMRHSDDELGIAVVECTAGLVVMAAEAYMAGCTADAFYPSHSISFVLAQRTKPDTSHGPKARSPIETNQGQGESPHMCKPQWRRESCRCSTFQPNFVQPKW